MQTTILPKGICLAIEKNMRRFIWGNDGPDDQTRKMHLVNWNLVASPKTTGGLGIRKLQDLNMSYMVKLGWRLHQERDSLWARSLTCKYKNSHSAKPSNAWKGIMAARPILESGRIRSVRNGRTTRFWMDKWITNYPLSQHLSTP